MRMGSGWVGTLGVRRIAIVLGAIIVAYFTTAWSLSIAAGRVNPNLALRLAPFNAEAKAKQAELLIGPEIEREAVERGKLLATEALTRSPASTRAIRVLAVSALLGGDEARADQLMQSALALSRRDLASNLYMIERAVAANRPGRALHFFDIALRTSPASNDQLMPVLANAIADDALFQYFDKLAARNPPWFSGFVASATYFAPPVRNVTRLAVRHPALTAGKDAQIPGLLLDRLVRDKDFAFANRYYRSLGRPGSRAGTLVRDEKITSSSYVGPFEWAFVVQEAFGGEVASQGGLRFYASDGGSGGVASQLLLLDPGRYSLASHLEAGFSPREGMAEWRVECMDGPQLGAFRAQSTGRGVAAARGVFQVPAQGCPAQRLALHVSAAAGSAGVEGTVRAVSISKANVGRQVPAGGTSE
jgi:hypothetical protein